MTRWLALPWLASMVLCSTALAQIQPAPTDPAAPPPGYPSEPPPPSGYPPPPSAYPAPPPGYSAQPGYYPPPPANYPPPYAVVRAPGAQTHDGFYLRLQLGGGYTSMSATSGPDELKLAGSGFSFAVALGGAISRNVIIYGTLVNSQAQDPEATANGMSFGSVNGNAGVVGIGPGLAYYLDPSNVFLAASFLASRLVFTNPDNTNNGRTDWGFTFEGLVGKEWWVSDNWGLGVSAQLLLGAMKDQEGGFSGVEVPTWHLVGLNLLFSATLN
jgi:hypothetical protein